MGVGVCSLASLQATFVNTQLVLEALGLTADVQYPASECFNTRTHTHTHTRTHTCMETEPCKRVIGIRKHVCCQGAVLARKDDQRLTSVVGIGLIVEVEAYIQCLYIQCLVVCVTLLAEVEAYIQCLYNRGLGPSHLTFTVQSAASYSMATAQQQNSTTSTSGAPEGAQRQRTLLQEGGPGMPQGPAQPMTPDAPMSLPYEAPPPPPLAPGKSY